MSMPDRRGTPYGCARSCSSSVMSGKGTWVQTRRDQLHAYRFMTRRAMSAVVTGEPDAVEPPMRRLVLFTILGVMIAIVVAATFAVIGLLRPGAGDDWAREGAVIVERDTGARYVMIDGELRPALNYASAVLASGASGPVEVELVAREKLASVERGPMIGVPGLPDSMPAAEDVVAGPVAVCSQIRADGVNASLHVQVDVGQDPTAAAVAADEGVYVISGGDRYLLWRGQRHRLDEQIGANALNLPPDPVPVGRAFIAAVPPGVPLAPPEMRDKGEPVDVPGRSNMVAGQVIRVDDGSWRVMLPDGVAVIDEVEARLLQAMRIGGASVPAEDMPYAEVARMPDSGQPATDLKEQFEGLPDAMPALAQATWDAGGACVVYDGSATPALAVPEGEAPSGEPSAETEESTFADEVVVRPGSAVLARAPEREAVHLIAEPGSVYTAATLAVLGGFGYADLEPVELPPELLAMIPAGGALDPAAALQAVVP